jgi:23S rRNA (uracil1939-C5)-methyltransferase
VVYEDDELLVVEKGPHEPTTPQGEYAGSLLARVRRISGAQGAVPIHRLDVGTGGLVMFARRPEHVAAWARVLAASSTRKTYVAAVRGVVPMKGAIARSLRENGKTYEARTRYRRLAIVAGHSVVRAMPDEGRTHQIRRHLALIGHPVLGDERYGDPATNRYFAEKHGLDRAFLHCLRLEFDHPRTLARQVVETPIGGDLRAVLARIGGAGTLRFLDQKNALGTMPG